MSWYGLLLLDFDSPSFNRVYVACRKAIRYVLNLPLTTHSRFLHLICKDSSVNSQLYNRFVKFLRSLSISNNTIVNMCYDLIVHGSGSPVSNSLSAVAQHFNSSRLDLHNATPPNPDCSDDDICLSHAIYDLLNIRIDCLNRVNDTFFSLHECNTLLYYLCTDFFNLLLI